MLFMMSCYRSLYLMRASFERPQFWSKCHGLIDVLIRPRHAAFKSAKGGFMQAQSRLTWLTWLLRARAIFGQAHSVDLKIGHVNDRAGGVQYVIICRGLVRIQLEIYLREWRCVWISVMAQLEIPQYEFVRKKAFVCEEKSAQWRNKRHHEIWS